MTRKAWPTVSDGDTWSAAQHNTYGRDNDLAYWVYTTAGDMAYAANSPADTLTRLPIGSAGQLLRSTGSAPAWGGALGLINKWGSADFSPAQTFSSTYADVTGATLSLTITATCTVVMQAMVVGRTANTSGKFCVRGQVGGTTDANYTNIYHRADGNMPLAYEYVLSGVTAGTYTCKLQCQKELTYNIVDSGRLFVYAIPE